MTTAVDSLVDHYLEDLEAELADLPASRRRELLDEVGEHIGVPARPSGRATPGWR